MLPKLNKVLPIKSWYLDPMHQCTDVTNYPKHFLLFPNSLIMLISALKCLISVWGKTSKIACHFLDYQYLASSKQNRILLWIMFKGKFSFFYSVNLDNWKGNSKLGYNNLKGWEDIEDARRLSAHLSLIFQGRLWTLGTLVLSWMFLFFWCQVLEMRMWY